MTKRSTKTVKSKNSSTIKTSIHSTGDIKMEPTKSINKKHASGKPKTNGSRAGKPKAGTLTVTDLRADTIIMTRKKTDKPASSLKKTAKPAVSAPKKSKIKVAVKSTGKPKAPKKIEKKTAVSEPQGPMKQYIKAGKACKVTFRLPGAAAPNAQMVTVVGDFNNWNVTDTKMKKLKNGDFKTTLELPCNREYRFRYLIDAHRWENDWFADKYIRNRYGSEDSVVIIEGHGSV